LPKANPFTPLPGAWVYIPENYDQIGAFWSPLIIRDPRASIAKRTEVMFINTSSELNALLVFLFLIFLTFLYLRDIVKTNQFQIILTCSINLK
jgi:hypothetical protein